MKIIPILCHACGSCETELEEIEVPDDATPDEIEKLVQAECLDEAGQWGSHWRKSGEEDE